MSKLTQCENFLFSALWDLKTRENLRFDNKTFGIIIYSASTPEADISNLCTSKEEFFNQLEIFKTQQLAEKVSIDITLLRQYFAFYEYVPTLAWYAKIYADAPANIRTELAYSFFGVKKNISVEEYCSTYTAIRQKVPLREAKKFFKNLKDEYPFGFFNEIDLTLLWNTLLAQDPLETLHPSFLKFLVIFRNNSNYKDTDFQYELKASLLKIYEQREDLLQDYRLLLPLMDIYFKEKEGASLFLEQEVWTSLVFNLSLVVARYFDNKLEEVIEAWLSHLKDKIPNHISSLKDIQLHFETRGQERIAFVNAQSTLDAPWSKQELQSLLEQIFITFSENETALHMLTQEEEKVLFEKVWLSFKTKKDIKPEKVNGEKKSDKFKI